MINGVVSKGLPLLFRQVNPEELPDDAALRALPLFSRVYIVPTEGTHVQKHIEGDKVWTILKFLDNEEGSE